jgi:hypothetical protein
MLHSRLGSWPFTQTIDKAGKACQGQTVSLFRKLVTYDRKSFITLAPDNLSEAHFDVDYGHFYDCQKDLNFSN